MGWDHKVEFQIRIVYVVCRVFRQLLNYYSIKPLLILVYFKGLERIICLAQVSTQYHKSSTNSGRKSGVKLKTARDGCQRCSLHNIKKVIIADII